MLASHALALVGVPMRRVIRIVQDQRDARYSLLKGYFHGADDDSVNDLDFERFSSLTLTKSAKSKGKSVSQLCLEELKIRLISVRHSNGISEDIHSDPVLDDGDTLVLCGKAENLAKAELQLL